MLRSSQKFLGILKYLVLLSYHVPQASHHHAPSEASSSDGEAENQNAMTNGSSSTNNGHLNAVLLNSGPPPATLSGSSPVDSLPSSTNAPSSQPGALPAHIDLPTMLAIFTFYISLIKIYWSILTQIHDSLNSANPSHPLLRLPPILPGLQLDGFGLGHHYSLQINVLVQVSMEFLNRTEKAIDALAGSQ